MMDVQNSQATVALPLQKVGVRNVKHPMGILQQDGSVQQSIGSCDLYVNLHETQRGTHMSRFLEIINQSHWILSLPTIVEMLQIITERFNTNDACINITCPFFISKTAPVSKATGMTDYIVSFSGSLTNNQPTATLTVQIPVTSLCPCSKEISNYGAHNQRTLITATIQSHVHIELEPLIKSIEQEGSCELYSILKRSDEKAVTEKAYENPRFVEDIVRNIGSQLQHQEYIKSYTIEAESLESIHNHSAYAMYNSRYV